MLIILQNSFELLLVHAVPAQEARIGLLHVPHYFPAPVAYDQVALADFRWLVIAVLDVGEAVEANELPHHLLLGRRPLVTPYRLVADLASVHVITTLSIPSIFILWDWWELILFVVEEGLKTFPYCNLYISKLVSKCVIIGQ